MIGQNLVAWRGESGKAYIADAYCPHMGAHLGLGGKVSGECIKCTFHGWSFHGSDGGVTNIPYSKTGRIQSYPLYGSTACYQMTLAHDFSS